MRALLDLLRDNEAAVLTMSDPCQELLLQAGARLKILDREHGEKELLELVHKAFFKLSLPQQDPGALVLCITPTSPLTPTSHLTR